MKWWSWHGPMAVRCLGSLSAALALFGTQGCIIGEEKCSAHQVELNQDDFKLCVCEPGSVIHPSGVGCTPCGENEEAKGDACVCKTGFAKLATDGACEKTEAGTACSGDTDCPTSYPFCASAPDGAGYCTLKECGKNADCPGTYSCEAAADYHYCKQAPTGLGAPCTSNADCESFEASSCDTFQTHTCLLQGCATGDSVCPNEWGCCDYSGLLGAPLSVCIEPAGLTDGACPQGGSLVTP
jgi:hypothetical protein